VNATYKNGLRSAGDFEQISEGLFFIAASPAARKLRTQAVLLAQVDVPVLISGERGSGKKVAAQFIHKLSARSGRKFIKVDCAGLTHELLDRELFGFESVSANGVRKSQLGKLEECEDGTLLLDEISELPKELQLKLLRVLQDKQFLRVGGETAIRADVRILGTISTDIEGALAVGQLHEDFYNRLSAFTLHVPALSERAEEIALLMDYFMQQLAKHYSLPPRKLSAAMLECCETHCWPGNLEELKDFVKRYLVIGDEELAIAELQQGEVVHDIRSLAVPENPDNRGGSASGLKSLIQTVKGEAERTAIAAALDKTGWNRKAAAQLLKVSYRTLLYKIDHYRMTPPDYPVTCTPNSTRDSGRHN